MKCNEAVIIRNVKIGCVIFVGIGITFVFMMLAILFGLSLLDKFTPSGERRALPESAKNIEEYSSTSWNGDCLRLLKAEMPESEYPAYISRLDNLVKYNPEIHTGDYSSIRMGAGDAPEWWDPPYTDETRYFIYTPGEDHVFYCVYGKGYVYAYCCYW